MQSLLNSNNYIKVCLLWWRYASEMPNALFMIMMIQDLDLRIPRFLINHGSNIDSTNGNGETPLMAAVHLNRYDLAELFLQHNANTSITDQQGNTALLHYNIFCNVNIIKLLIEGYNADINYINPLTYHTLAMQMILYDYSPNVFRYLLSTQQINLNLCDIEGFSLVGLAVLKNNQDVIQLLSEFKYLFNIKNLNQEIPLMYSKSYKMNCMLLEYGSNVNSTDNANKTPLFNATDIKTARLFLSYNANINHQDENGDTVLMHAAVNQNPNLVAYLLENGANVNIVNRIGLTPIMIGACSNYTITKMLINKGANLDNFDNSQTFSPIFNSIVFPDLTDIFELLVENGANVNSKDTYGNTPLFYSIQKKRIKIFLILLTHPEIDINTEDEDDNTPLHYAIRQQNYEMTISLLRHGSDIFHSNRYGSYIINTNIWGQKLIMRFLSDEIASLKILDMLADMLEDENCLFDDNVMTLIKDFYTKSYARN